MKKHLVLILFTVFMVYCLSAQDIHVTFSATGAAASIDSIRVTNLSNEQSLVMPGDQTLTLRQGYTGIERSTLEETQVQVYPNPCNGTTARSAGWLCRDPALERNHSGKGWCVEGKPQVVLPRKTGPVHDEYFAAHDDGVVPLCEEEYR